MMKSIRLALLCLLAAGCATRPADRLELCVGTYGEHLYNVSFSEGRFSDVRPVAAPNASFVLPREGGVLLAVSEQDPRSGICSFRGDSLTALNGDIGGSPCYLMQIDGLPYVLTADYNGGSISVFAEEPEGTVGRLVQRVQYSGSGPVRGNQDRAHVHQLKAIPASIAASCGLQGTWLLATDLGADSIHVLRVSDEAGAGGPLLTDCPALTFALPAGSGPRHMELNEPLGLLYCLTELSGDVLTWKIASAADGTPVFQPLQCLKADDADGGGSADIHLHPSGRFLYTSHRLRDDGISVFRVGADGLLTKVSRTPTEGHPRHFLLTPDGRWLLVACRDGHCVQVFAINDETGCLTEVDSRLEVKGDGPVCVALWK